MQFKSVKPSPHAAATVDYILSVFECVCVPGCMYVSGYFKALLIKQFFLSKQHFRYTVFTYLPALASQNHSQSKQMY